MTEHKIICPECSAVVITSYPEVLLWERCPSCRHHLWDTGDLMMAELTTKERHDGKRAVSAARMHSN